MDESKQEYATRDDGSIVITLKFPCQLADRKLTEVVVHRPTLDDVLRAGDLAVQENQAKLAAALTGINAEELKKLDYFADYARVTDVIMGFQSAK